MLWDERIPGEIHGRNPAILVVHGQELDGKLLAVRLQTIPPAPPSGSSDIIDMARLLGLRVLAAGSIRLNFARAFSSRIAFKGSSPMPGRPSMPSACAV